MEAPDLGPALTTRRLQGVVLGAVMDGGVLKQSVDGFRLNWHQTQNEIDEFIHDLTKTENGISFAKMISLAFQVTWIEQDFSLHTSPLLKSYGPVRSAQTCWSRVIRIRSNAIQFVDIQRLKFEPIVTIMKRVKLEQKVPVTDTGFEVLSCFPFEECLMARPL